MNVQQQALNLIKENGGSATRGQIKQLVEFTKKGANEFYTGTLCWRLVSRGFISIDKSGPQRGLDMVYNITPAGNRYLRNKGKVTKKPITVAAKLSNLGSVAPVERQSMPVEKLIRGSIIRDLLLSKFDQLSASERCGLLEIYNVIESNTKNQQQ